jgi:plastocyanin domain-containing protein
MRIKILLVAICAAFILAGSPTSGANAQARRWRGKGGALKVQTANVALTERGYEPDGLRLRRGVPARVTFTRKVPATCATEVMLPDYGVRRALPLGEPVIVEFMPKKTGEFTFSCGMGMVKGTLIVR